MYKHNFIGNQAIHALYIYSKKCHNETPTFLEAMRKVHILYIDEKYAAIQNNSISKHSSKWKLYEKSVVLN